MVILCCPQKTLEAIKAYAAWHLTLSSEESTAPSVERRVPEYNL